jgi:hypothetical protein
MDYLEKKRIERIRGMNHTEVETVPAQHPSQVAHP